MTHILGPFHHQQRYQEPQRLIWSIFSPHLVSKGTLTLIRIRTLKIHQPQHRLSFLSRVQYRHDPLEVSSPFEPIQSSASDGSPTSGCFVEQQSTWAIEDNTGNEPMVPPIQSTRSTRLPLIPCLSYSILMPTKRMPELMLLFWSVRGLKVQNMIYNSPTYLYTVKLWSISSSPMQAVRNQLLSVAVPRHQPKQPVMTEWWPEEEGFDWYYSIQAQAWQAGCYGNDRSWIRWVLGTISRAQRPTFLSSHDLHVKLLERM